MEEVKMVQEDMFEEINKQLTDLDKVAEKVENKPEPKDKFDILKEVLEDMQQKIENIDKIEEYQTHLTEVLSEYGNEFKDLIDESEKQLSNLSGQKPILVEKHQKLENLINFVESEQDKFETTCVRNALNEFMDIFGMFE